MAKAMGCHLGALCLSSNSLQGLSLVAEVLCHIKFNQLNV